MQSLPSGNAGGRAVQPSSYTPPSTPVLYVSSKDRVNAFDPTASGSTPPNRTIFVHANQVDSIAGIAAAADGTLDVLQNYFPASDNLSHCRVVIMSATANGDAAALNPKIDCPGNGDPTTGYGIAKNPVVGGFDVLFVDPNTGEEYVKRFTQSNDGAGTAAYSSYLALPSTAYRHLATDRGGHDYVDDNAGNVRKYTYSATGDPNAPTAQYFSVGNTSGAMAVSPVDLTLYVVLPGAANGGDRLAAFLPSDYTGMHGLVLPSYAYDFQAGSSVTALATDQNGNLYVGITTPNGARVKTFSPHFAGGAPIRNLDALPGDGATAITGLALY